MTNKKEILLKMIAGCLEKAKYEMSKIKKHLPPGIMDTVFDSEIKEVEDSYEKLKTIQDYDSCLTAVISGENDVMLSWLHQYELKEVNRKKWQSTMFKYKTTRFYTTN